MPDNQQSALNPPGSPTAPASLSPTARNVKRMLSPSPKPSSPVRSRFSPIPVTSTPTSENSSKNPQQFCLRWNNYQTNLTNVFDQLLQNESFVDVTLACDGNSIKAHKMVLSACSPYFQSLFFENPCQHPIVILRDVKWPELKAAVEFMYKGEINLCQEQIGPLLSVAEMLQIRGLADVNGEHGSNKPQHSVLPEITPAVKHPRISARSECDLNNLDFLTNNSMPTTASMRYQRKRSWPQTANNSNNNSNSDDNNINNNNNNKNNSNKNNSNNNNSSTNSSDNGSSGNCINNNRERSNLDTPNLDIIDSHSPSSTMASVANARPSSSSPQPPAVATSPSHASQPSNTPTPTPPFSIPPLDAMALSQLGITHSEEMEIKPGIAEMIREEERVSIQFKHHIALFHADKQ